MRWLLALLPLLLALRTPPASAQSTFATVDAYQEDGAYSLIIVPHSWNGAFIVYAHGYDADYRNIRPYPSEIPPANIATQLTGADAILQIPLALRNRGRPTEARVR